MTVAELIAMLQALPPDLPVMISGYEGGYADVTVAVQRPVVLNANTDWYYGPHEDEDTYFHDGTPEGKAIVPAIIIRS